MKVLVVALAVLAAAVASVTITALPGFFSARREPGAMESLVVRRLRRAAIPVDVRRLENPIGASAEVLAEAREHFGEHCAVCHGNDGRGKTDIGPNFYPPVPDLTAREIQSLSDAELYYAIREGVRFSGMPAWGSHGEEGDWANWQLVHFVRHLPKLTPDELRDMERGGTETTPPAHEHGHQHEH
jgi:mono/diheme cytochrome c family protein